MLKMSHSTEVREFSNSTIWFDENGIMYSRSKAAAMQSMEELKNVLEYINEKAGGKKICMLLDVTYAAETSREEREYAAEELPKNVKAIAMVSDSVMGNMLANLFFKLKSQPYPVKMFKSEKDALEWLMNYL